MNKIKFAIISLLAIVFVSSTGVWVANAQDFRSGDVVSVTKSDKVDSTLYVAGKTVTIDAEVNGDVFCGGQTVTINGNVHGDVICAAQTLTVKGIIDGDLRLAGQTVIVDAQTGGNITVASETFMLESGSETGGDVTIGSGDATLKGFVGRDIAVGTRDLVLAGTVGRNITTDSENTKLSSEARIMGNINYTSFNTLQRASGSEVNGKVTKTDPPAERRHEPVDETAAFVGQFIYWYVAMLITALTLVFVLPKMFQRVTDRAFPSPWKALLIGFVACIVAPIAMILIGITIVGLPLVLVAGMAWLLVLLLSAPVASYYVGRLATKNSRTPLITMLAGASIVLVVSAVPVVNIIVFFAVIWFGSGMILLEIYRRTVRPLRQRENAATKTKKKELSKTS
jgi:cytoskeletal protein CcmA (bactofilin family)